MEMLSSSTNVDFRGRRRSTCAGLTIKVDNKPNTTSRWGLGAASKDNNNPGVLSQLDNCTETRLA